MKQAEFVQYIMTKEGQLEITASASGITSIRFTDKVCEERPNTHTASAVAQLQEYLRGEREQFDLALDAQGTDFQKRVWKALMDIPYGATCSYGDIARALGNPKAVRAVGAANGQNPISIVVPCHRVIGSNGKLTGYAGGLTRKAWLLSMETRQPALEGLE